MQEIEVIYASPTAKEFVDLRAAAGMRERKVSSAEKGIPHSVFWITLRNQGKLIGMGRIVGDGSTVVQITDIAVDPEHQGKGYGSFIFDRIREFILAEIPDDAFEIFKSFLDKGKFIEPIACEKLSKSKQNAFQIFRCGSYKFFGELIQSRPDLPYRLGFHVE